MQAALSMSFAICFMKQPLIGNLMYISAKLNIISALSDDSFQVKINQQCIDVIINKKHYDATGYQQYHRIIRQVYTAEQQLFEA